MERIKLIKSDGYWRGKIENLLYSDGDIVNEILKLKNELLKSCVDESSGNSAAFPSNNIRSRLSLDEIEKESKEWAASRSVGNKEQDDECAYDFKCGMITARNKLSKSNGC